MTDLTFDCMGTTIRLVVADEPTALACQEFLHDFDRALSRFRPDSELSRLNADPREDVPASALLRGAITAGLMAAELTQGLFDPTLTPALEANGYDRTRRDPELPLQEALLLAPRRQPASGATGWTRVQLTDHSIRRPRGLAFDTGGIGKGLAVDMLALRLNGGAWAIDAGGDLRVSGSYDVRVRHPLTQDTIKTLRLTDQAVATSGIDRRLWRADDGTPRHHILDPATEQPAWTGVIGATALAPTATEADALAKAALLSGPRDAHKWLRRHGGLFITDDGTVLEA